MHQTPKKTIMRWHPFDEFMHDALYAPGRGYYARGDRVFGRLAADGSDFVTAPEMSNRFGQCLAAQAHQVLAITGGGVTEFGAGSGALAEQVLLHLDLLSKEELPSHNLRPKTAIFPYNIVDVSAALQQQQKERLAAWGERVAWLQALPDAISGVVLGNEVLDAMPVKLLARTGGVWHERGVVNEGSAWRFADAPTALCPPSEVDGDHDYVTEIHPQAEAFIRTLAERMLRGESEHSGGCLALFIDYGYPEREYYHPARHMGTLMCHKGHLADSNPLIDVGQKDITAHVNFTGIAVAAQEAGLEVVGYTSQARFLMNCGILQMLETAHISERAAAQKLLTEHEMGTLFNVVALATPRLAQKLGGGSAMHGFAQGDFTHKL